MRRLLDLTLPTRAENLAYDEALLDAAEAGECGEVLRFWESPRHFVVVGYANKVALEVNVPACEVRGVPILRRCSGGGAVVQGPGCLNYALVLGITHDGPTHSITAANQFILERNREAIQSAIGNRQSAIRVQGHTDLTLAGRKFSGNSQRRRKHYLLFHGTFLLHFDLPLVSELLPMPSKQPDYRERRTHDRFLTNLDCAAEAAKTALCKTWDATADAKLVPLPNLSLLAEKYASANWNWRF